MIAVLFDKEGLLANFYNVEKFVVYNKSETFNIVKEIDNFIFEKDDIKLFRKSLQDLLEKLGEYKIMLGNQIIGVPLYFFDKNGFKVCEAELFSERVLQEIHEDYIEKKKALKTMKTMKN